MNAISFNKAVSTILSAVQPLPEENVSLAHALGRVAAESVVADEDAVPFPRSAMDGFAVRANECVLATQKNPIELPVAGQVFAEKGESILAHGTAFTITTGAPIPLGADAVIPQERTQRNGATVKIFAPVVPGDCVFPPGEDFRQGDELIAIREVLNPGKLALLAFAGRPTVRAFRRPRVAIVCTGNELVDITATPTRGQVRNSNGACVRVELPPPIVGPIVPRRPIMPPPPLPQPRRLGPSLPIGPPHGPIFRGPPGPAPFHR